MNEPGTITLWLEQLKEGDREVVQELWEEYFLRLVQMARLRLRGLPENVGDQEGLALSAFNSFCLAAEAGRFPRLDDRDDLWQVLLLLVRRKAANLWKHHTRQVRDFRRTVNAPDLSPDSEEGSFLDLIQGEEPDPALTAEVTAECERLLGLLPTAELRDIAILRMEGWTNAQIAERLDCSVQNVERKAGRIRRHWQNEMPD